MNEKEYLSVKDISELTLQSARNVRRIIKALNGTVSIELLHMCAAKGHWRVHNLLLSSFKPQRIRRDNYYALSVDPCSNYSESDIDEIMMFVYKQMNSSKLEINYVVEQKKANNRNHLHCYIKCSNKKKLLQFIKLGFANVSYHQSPIFDLEIWIHYITKDGSQIKTLKN
jgi:hypothetical protein